MLKILKTFLSFFTTITTAILIIVSIDTGLNDYTSIPQNCHLRIIIAGFVTAAVTTAVFSFEIKTRKQYLIITAVHYVLLCGIMVGLGISFGWIDPAVLGIFIMCLYVAGVYGIVSAVMYVLEKKEADELNRALRERKKK